MAALVAFCEKVNKAAKKEKCREILKDEKSLKEIERVGADVLTQCKVPILVEYQAVGERADHRFFSLPKSTVAAAKAYLKAEQPEYKLKEVIELYSGDDGQTSSILCMDFVDPDCGYDDFSGKRQLYFYVATESLWSSSGKPKEPLKCLCEQLGVAPNALAPNTWVSISY